MTALESFEKSSEEAGVQKTYYADTLTSDELSKLIRSLPASSFPINVIDRFESQGTWVNGRRRAVIPLSGWILKRIDENTKTTRSRELEDSVIEPMTKIAKKFLEKVNSSLIRDYEKDMTDSIRGTYQAFNEQLFGARYTANVPIAPTCIC